MAGRGARKGSGKHRNEAPADLEAAAEGAIQGFARKHERWILVGLFVVAVLWRAIYCWAIGRSPFAEDLSVDAAAHHEWARRISEGDLTFGGVFFRAPLYYYVLGGLYWVFGADPDVARVFQILVGAATCLVIHRIAKRVFDPVVAPAVALIAGAMACVYGMYVYFANELLIETLALFLNVSGLALLLSALETPRLRRWFASGLIFGLAAITQPNVLVFVTLALLWNFLRFRAVWGRGPTLQRLSVLVLGLALMIAPVTIYNAVVGGDRVLISSQGGVNLFIGNNPEANGVSAYVPGARLDWNGFLEDTNRIAQRALGNPNAKPSEISAYWAGRAFDFMIEQPAQFLWLTARKVYFFFNAHEAANNRSLRPMTDFSFLFSYLTLRFWLVFPLAVAGMVLAGRGERHRSLLLLFLAAQAGSFVLFFVNARFRLSVTPIMLVFAAYAVYAVATAAGGLRGFVKDRRARAALLMAVIAGLAIAPHPRLVSEERWRGQLNYAAVLIKAKRFAEAAEVLEAAKAKSTEPDAHVMLGRLALDSLGDADRSLENFRAAVAIAPNNADTLADAGTAHFFAGKPAEAIPLLSRAIARNPDSPMPQLTLAEAHEKLGQIKQAAEVRATLAGTFLRRGDAGRARREVDRALALDPENVAAQRLRGQFDGTP